jgi:hypothetical protein
MGLTTPPLKKIVTKSEKATVAFEDDKGPLRAVEPMMVMERSSHKLIKGAITSI